MARRETRERIAAAENALSAQNAAYHGIKQNAEEALTEEAKALLAAPVELSLRVQKSIEDATVAYYPFETTEPIPDSKLSEILRKPESPPKELVTVDRAKIVRNLGTVVGAKPGEKPATRQPQVIPTNYVRDQMVYMPSGLPGGAPAIVQAPELRDGVKGKGLFFTEENKGTLAQGRRLLRPHAGFLDRLLVFTSATDMPTWCPSSITAMRTTRAAPDIGSSWRINASTSIWRTRGHST